MLNNVFKVLISVRAKLFFGFTMMALLIMMLGGYSYFSINNAGVVVKDTFDRPMMAINYARSASQVFARLESDIQRQRHQSYMGAETRISDIEDQLQTFRGDLKIAQQRSIAPRAESFFDDIDTTILKWSSLVLDADNINNEDRMNQADELATTILENLDIIVELQTNESFRNRESAIEKMKNVRELSLWAVIIALALSVLGSMWLAFTIIWPLKAAADAARKISAGNFDIEIPRGGDDETGVLLKTLSVMQEKIRYRMEKEQNSRALAQTRLMESLANSKDAILLTNNIGTIIVVNEQVKKMLPHLTDENVMGQSFATYFHINGAPRGIECTLYEDDSELQLPEGKWARVNASDTQEGGRLFIWSDITKAKVRSERLRIARDEAEAASKAKTLFLAAMSHELRTPLNAVIGLSDVISMQTKNAPQTAKLSEMAALISKNGSHLLHIVSDVLTIAEGDNTEAMSTDMTHVNLLDVLTFCEDTIRPEASKKSLRLIWDIGQTPITLQGDEQRLQQLFLNLLSNAVTFNKDGGAIKLVLQVHKDKVAIIDIIDTGIGIPEESMETIFEPFMQVDKGYSRKYDGVGLGLSVAKQMLDLHKGRMTIKSEVDRGTHIRIALPIFTERQDDPSMLAA